MKTERLAIIDLGTNTFHLFIADTDGKTTQSVYAEKIPVRIGKGGINHGFILEDACERALHTLEHFKNKTDEFEVQRIYATATSAFRNAKNGQELADKIKSVTGIEISIISGDREAELIYFGVKEALKLGEEKSLIVDIGGGSVEFILANENTIFWKQSFEIGGQRLMDLFQKSDPIKEEEIKILQQYLSEKLAPLSIALEKFPTDVVVGSAGSFDTFSDIDLRKKGFDFCVETKKEYEISLSDFHEIYHELISKERNARMTIPGMLELRVDMIVVAAILTRYILEHYAMKRLRVSTYALKEGVLSRIMKGETIIASQ
jgi:exopolyphosphatase/guanosine-5'-triphosphate,3'-diphosphate pyrophosphatase